MEKKMTKKEMFGRLIELLQGTGADDKDELVAGIQHEIDLLDKKSEKSKGYARKKVEDVLKDAILYCLSSCEFRITSEIVADLAEDFEDLTAAKITARLTALVKEGKVIKEDVKTEDKRTVKGYKLVA